jgi:SAM-dependent methyltransferase
MTGDARRFFDAIAGRYEREYALSTEESRMRMARVLGELPAAPATVLDLGVGTGRELAALLDRGYAPTGLDVSPAMLERCAHRTRTIPLLEADFWQPLPFPDGTFDAAIALHGTLAHPPDDAAPSRLARELARILRPAGVWIFEVPSPDWFETAASDARVRRTGPSTSLYEDPATSASIETRLLSESAWTAALGPSWQVRFDRPRHAEWLVVARLAR